MNEEKEKSNKEKEDQITNLNNEISKIKLLNEEKEKSNKEKEDEIINLNNKIKEMSNEILSKNTELENNKDIISKIQSENSQLKNKIEMNGNQGQNENQDLLNQNTKLMKDNDNFRNKNLEYCKKIDNIKKEVEKYKKEIEQSKLKINNQLNDNQIGEIQLNSKINKDEIERLKKEIRNEYEQKLKEKFQKEIASQIKKKEEEMLKKINDKTEELIKSYKSKYDQKEVDLNGKIDKISKLIINKSQLENNNMNISFCDTIHKGIMCKKCLQMPIIGYRYKCSVCDDFDLCSKCEEENSRTNHHPHDFIKIRNNKNQKQDNNNNFLKIMNKEINNINNNNINNYLNEENENVLEEIQNDDVNQYSYECLNITQLSSYLYEGTPECKIQIILRNNGNSAWPMNNSKLIFDEFCDFKTEEVILKPQKPGEQELYEIVFKGLSGYPANEYNSILKFSVNGQSFGDELKIKFVIKPKKVPGDELSKYKDKIEEFRDLYGLGKDDYSDDKILNALKANNFDYALAFGNLFD